MTASEQPERQFHEESKALEAEFCRLRSAGDRDGLARILDESFGIKIKRMLSFRFRLSNDDLLSVYGMAWCKAVDRASQYRREATCSGVAPWFAQIAFNEAVDFKRSQRWTLVTNHDVDSAAAVDPGLQQEAHDAVHSALAELEQGDWLAAQAILIDLAYGGKAPTRVIQNRTGCARQTAYNARSRGRKALARLLRELTEDA